MDDEKVKKLVNDHWAYLEKVLRNTFNAVSGNHDEYIETIGFHYRTAMEHGYKHGHDDTIREWEKAGYPASDIVIKISPNAIIDEDTVSMPSYDLTDEKMSSDVVTDEGLDEINPGIVNKGVIG